jgi:hypothetical protein
MVVEVEDQGSLEALNYYWLLNAAVVRPTRS